MKIRVKCVKSGKNKRKKKGVIKWKISNFGRFFGNYINSFLMNDSTQRGRFRAQLSRYNSLFIFPPCRFPDRPVTFRFPIRHILCCCRSLSSIVCYAKQHYEQQQQQQQQQSRSICGRWVAALGDSVILLGLGLDWLDSRSILSLETHVKKFSAFSYRNFLLFSTVFCVFFFDWNDLVLRLCSCALFVDQQSENMTVKENYLTVLLLLLLLNTRRSPSFHSTLFLF